MRNLAWLGVVAVCLLFAPPVVAQETVTFTPRLPAGSGALRLTGASYRPAGAGPHPALVILHGCGGILQSYFEWAEFLKDQGYAGLVVDSYGARGVRETCTGRSRVPVLDRVRDAYGALAFLTQQTFVDPNRVGIMGFSQGGTTTLFANFADVARQYPLASRFKVAAPLYPECQDFPGSGFVVQNRPVNAPMLILTGALDDWTPAAYCDALVAQAMIRGESAYIRVYPGAHHSFDNLRAPVTYLRDVLNPHNPAGRGATVAGNRAARDAARFDLLAFLRTYL